MNDYLNQSATDLATARAAGVADPEAYSAAIAALKSSIALPETDATPAQYATGLDDVTALNRFFDTNGLYGVSAPSTSLAAFVAELQQEVRQGYLSAANATPDESLKAAPEATVRCPVLSSLSVGSPFGCRIGSPTQGPAVLVGTVQQAGATGFDAWVATGAARFACSGDAAELSTAEAQVAAQLGACS